MAVFVNIRRTTALITKLYGEVKKSGQTS